MPAPPYGLLNQQRPGMLNRRSFAPLADSLTGIGIGLLSQQPGPYPTSPLQALGPGLQYGQQLTQDRRQNERQDARLSQDQQEFELRRQALEREAQAQAAEDARTAAKQQAFDQLLPTLPEQIRPVAQAMGPDFLDVYGKEAVAQQFPDPDKWDIKTIREGNQDVTYRINPQTGAKEKLGGGAAFAPVKPDEPTADIQEYNFATQQGFKGTYMDYLASKKGQGFSMTMPDGTTVQMGGAIKPPTEGQQQAAARAQLLQSGVSALEELYNDPNISPMRLAGAETLSAAGPFGRLAAENLRSDSEQQFEAAKASALEGIAASITGAGVTKDQFTRYTNMLPSINDKPETKKTKLEAANQFLHVLLKNAGAAAGPVYENRDKDAAPVTIRYDAQGNRLPDGGTP